MKSLFLITILFLFSITYGKDGSVEGYWQTIDDSTNKPRSIIQLYLKDGELRAKIVKIYLRKDEEENPLCTKCKGDKKDKPALGMEVLEGVRWDGEEYSGGTVLDPDNGKTYRCKISLMDNGGKIKIRGYIGISLLGRTQYWNRVSSPNG
jgi:uncharacterized protein (DUF2147 family)